MTQLYIAGSSNEIERIQGFMEIVKGYGLSISYDWTRDPMWQVASPSDAQLVCCARQDAEAVATSDVVWYCTPEDKSGKSEGSHFELGVAHALKKPLIVSGPLAGTRIFPRLARFRFATHEEALQCLKDRTWAPALTPSLRERFLAAVGNPYVAKVTIPPGASREDRQVALELAAEGLLRATPTPDGGLCVTPKELV